MGEIECLLVVPVPRLGECHGNVLRTVSLREALRVLDVSVVLDASVLAHLHVVDVDVGVRIVAFAAIVSVHRASELAVGLVVVVSASEEVVQLEPDAGDFVDVRGKVGSHSVLSVVAGTALVICQVGDGTQCVGEAEVLQGIAEVAEGLEEENIAVLLAVQEYAVQAWSTQIAQEVVLSRVAFREVEVLEVVHRGVGILGINHRSQPRLYAPLELSDGYLYLRRVRNV